MSVDYWTLTGSSSDHIILAVGCLSSRELDKVGISLVDSFMFCSIYFV